MFIEPVQQWNPPVGAKETAARILCAIGVPAFARWRNSRRLAILMYHGVEAEPVRPRCSYVLDVATLRQQLTYVRRHFNVLPIEEALRRLRDGTLPRRAAVLTFDDGTRNLATHAAPVLRDLGLPAAVFLARGRSAGSSVLRAACPCCRASLSLCGVAFSVRSWSCGADISGRRPPIR